MNGYKIVYQFKGMTEIRKSAAKNLANILEVEVSLNMNEETAWPATI